MGIFSFITPVVSQSCDPSEIILICRFGAQYIFRFIINDEYSCAV